MSCFLENQMFLIDVESGEASIRMAAQRSLIKGILSGTGDTDVTGDFEKSRSGSFRRQAMSRHREEIMKIRLAVPLVGLAISFALASSAQQKEPMLSEQDRQQLGALHKKWDEAENNNDAAALAALFTEDATFVTDKGPLSGREAIKQWFADDFKEWRHSNHIHKPDSNSARIIGTAGNVALNGEFSLTVQGKTGGPIPVKGYWSEIDTREGGDWKIRMHTFNITPATVAPAQTK
jgi:uncharacterized protein (TIGR02246 family)